MSSFSEEDRAREWMFDIVTCAAARRMAEATAEAQEVIALWLVTARDEAFRSRAKVPAEGCLN